MASHARRRRFLVASGCGPANPVCHSKFPSSVQSSLPGFPTATCSDTEASATFLSSSGLCKADLSAPCNPGSFGVDVGPGPDFKICALCPAGKRYGSPRKQAITRAEKLGCTVVA